MGPNRTSKSFSKFLHLGLSCCLSTSGFRCQSCNFVRRSHFGRSDGLLGSSTFRKSSCQSTLLYRLDRPYYGGGRTKACVTCHQSGWVSSSSETFHMTHNVQSIWTHRGICVELGVCQPCWHNNIGLLLWSASYSLCKAWCASLFRQSGCIQRKSPPCISCRTQSWYPWVPEGHTCLCLWKVRGSKREACRAPHLRLQPSCPCHYCFRPRLRHLRRDCVF